MLHPLNVGSNLHLLLGIPECVIYLTQPLSVENVMDSLRECNLHNDDLSLIGHTLYTDLPLKRTLHNADGVLVHDKFKSRAMVLTSHSTPTNEKDMEVIPSIEIPENHSPFVVKRCPMTSCLTSIINASIVTRN